MTPKEKADELVYRFSTPIKVFSQLEGWIIHVDSSKAKGHALVAVDELIKIHYLLTTTQDTSPSINYWKDVKQELEKL
jgi:hypothetical protein